MTNIKNIFSDRRKKEQETRLTYSKYIFNSHLIMFLIIVLGAIMINYSRWLDIATNFELTSVFLATAAIFSYLVVSAKIKTFIKEADSVFLLPLEKYYNKVVLKTTLQSAIKQVIFLIVFYIATKPILDKIGENNSLFSKITVVLLIIVIIYSRIYRLLEVVYFGEKLSTKILFFVTIFSQIITIAFDIRYLTIINFIFILLLVFVFYREHNNAKNISGDKTKSPYLLNWSAAAEYDKHRNENYLKFVNMFVDVPLSGIKVARRKYFDILLPKLTEDNFTKENSFKYYYYRVFLRQENTVFLALRLLLISGIIIYSFNNIYVNIVVILSYSYLTIIQLIPLYKQINNNIWHSILPVSNEIKINSFKKLLSLVMTITSFVLVIIGILVVKINITNLGLNIIAFVIANLICRIFINKIK